MIRLGFIDYFLDEWHANNYPDWLRRQAEARGIKLDLGYAWADCERGLTTDAWCRKYRMRRMQSQEALIEACDAIIVLSPDHPEQHERLGRLALESGKRVYMDKTFAPDLACGVRLFDRRRPTERRCSPPRRCDSPGSWKTSGLAALRVRFFAPRLARRV